MSGKELYGLVLTGGKSSRMKTDKSALDYHGQPQSVVCFYILSQFCGNVFISNRKDQAAMAGQRPFPQIHDLEEYQDIGPLGGILTAMKTFPDKSWLVLACDLPFLNKVVLEALIAQRDSGKLATAYQSAHDGLPEPLCAIYEARAFDVMTDYYRKGVFCPRKILQQSDIQLLNLRYPKALDNINDPDEYQEAQQEIQDRHE